MFSSDYPDPSVERCSLSLIDFISRAKNPRGAPRQTRRDAINDQGGMCLVQWAVSGSLLRIGSVNMM